MKISKRLIFQKMIYRADLRANPNMIYLFGDNEKRQGYGGQAGEMRGEPNAIGIPTKYLPSNFDNSFYSDKNYIHNCNIISKCFLDIPEDVDIVIPADGLGTGLAELPTRAPKTFLFLQQCIEFLKQDRQIIYED